jgi:UDP-GlcNAc:undecaprenyl-phosphate GlcNAc-1-phosphate transferase
VTRPLAIAAVALASAVVLTPLAMVVARWTGTVDRPGPLKPHASPVPYLGGVAVFFAAVVGGAVGHPAVLAPLAGALVLGVLDDRFDLPAGGRLIGQVAIGAGVAAVITTKIGGAGGRVLVGLAVVVLMNGVNFLDGLDGLAGGVTAVACAGFAVMLSGDGRDLAVAVAAAVVGFLLYNRPPARIYLGDGGAYFLGAAMAALLAWSWAPGTRHPVSVASLAVVGVPVTELAAAVVRRLRAGRAVSSGDRRHPYDLLVARGWPVVATSLAYAATELVVVVAAVAASKAGAIAAPIAVVVVAALALVGLAGACGALSPGPPVPA